MSFFKNRPLCLFCFIWIIMITVGFFLPYKALFCLAAAGMILLATAFVIPHFRKHGAGGGLFSSTTVIRVSAAALLLTLPLLVMAAYRSFYADTFSVYEKEESLTVTGTVQSVSYATDYGACYVLQTDTINGNEQKVKISLTVPSASLLHTGDVIAAQVTPVPKATDTGLSERMMTAADGIVGSVETDEIAAVTVTDTGKTSFAGMWRAVNERAAQRLLAACGKKQGGLMAALLLGRKDLADDSAVRNFARSGISHVLALSGFHVSVLAGGMDYVLKKCRIGKGIRMAICTALLLLFLCLTGFLPSAVRSVIMLFILFCSRWLYADSDTPTFLTVTVALMMTFFPASAVDVSLWMSFAATFGVLLGVAFLQKMPRGRNPLGKVLAKTLQGITISLFAIVCVLPLSFLFFGTVSVMAPLATLIAVPFCYVLMIGGLVTLAVSCTLGAAAAQAIGYIPGQAARLLSDVMNTTAQMKNVVYSLNLPFVPAVLVLLLVLFFLWAFLHWEKKWMVVLPIACAVGLYGVCLSVWRAENGAEMSVTYLRRNSSEIILLSQADESVMVHVGDGYYTDFREGWEILESSGATELSALFLTHYHTAEIGSFEKLAADVIIRRLYVPEPVNETEYYMLSALFDRAQAANVPVCICRDDTPVTIFERGSLTLYRGTLSRSSHPVIAFSVTGTDGKFVYIGASAAEIIDCGALLSDCTCLLAGVHGPGGKQVLDASVPACQTLIVPQTDTLALLSDGMLQSLSPNCAVFLDTFQWNGKPVSLDNKDGAVIQ